jgi:hypothetical protein
VGERFNYSILLLHDKINKLEENIRTTSLDVKSILKALEPKESSDNSMDEDPR